MTGADDTVTASATISATGLAKLEAAALALGITAEELLKRLIAKELHKRMVEHDPR